MKRTLVGHWLWILVLALFVFSGDAWARTRRHARRATTSADRASAAKKTTPRKHRAKRRHARWYGQTWSTSPFADSTSSDELSGEDPVVREAAANALGPLNGSIVVVDPNNGRVLSLVNQQMALGRGYSPCSTIKLPVALAALHEGLVTKDTPVRLGRRWSLNMTEALARSNNPYFEHLGREVGFEKLSKYAREFGFGELAGHHIAGETLGTFPEAPPRNGGVARMSSFGEEVNVTPLQLAAFVSAVANGGTLYYLQYPQTEAERENFQPRVKRQLDDVKDLLPQLREGMMAAVERGTARRLFDPYDQVAGKTGTCSEGGTRLGWFASYETPVHPKVVVVVLLRGGRYTVGPRAAEIAGRVYRNLHERNYYTARDQQAPAPDKVTPATALFDAVK